MGKQITWLQLTLILPLIILFGCFHDAEDWTKAKLLNSAQGYQEFIDNHSSSPLTVTAEYKIDSLGYIEVLKTKNFDSIETYISSHLPNEFIENSLDTIIIPVKIGNQTWMSHNLNSVRFRNEAIIPEVKSAKEWIEAGKEGKPAWCYYEGFDSYNHRYWYYGKLYNWFAVHDNRGLAPKGWHIATDKDLEELLDYLGENSDQKMKSATDWKSNQSGTNSSGFNGFPGGGRVGYTGEFFNNTYFGIWWLSDFQVNKEIWNNVPKDRIYAHYFFLTYDNHFQPDVYFDPDNGFSVRCVKN
jgi:uncharacterized protein (TIGR02145 family)